MKLQGTVFVTHIGARVGVQKRSLTIRVPDQPMHRVPMEGTEALVVIGPVQVSNDALTRCVKANIRVSSLTRAGRVRWQVVSPTSGNVHLRVAQVRAHDDEQHRKAIARRMVMGKIGNSRSVTKRWSWDSNPDSGPSVDLSEVAAALMRRLQAAASAESLDQLRGVEGDAARSYFKGLGAHLSPLGTPLSFVRRSRRPPRDPVNAALGFGYGVLTTELTGAADAVGLDPQIGFLHGVRSGRPALALDVLEEFRAPLVDQFVVGALRRRMLRLEHFREMPGGSWLLTDEGRRLFLDLYESRRQESVPHPILDRQVPRWSLPITQMTLLARHLRGDIEHYHPWRAV